MVNKKNANSTKPLELTPGDIRRIREGLGLSQVEAGELLGGGPRAFTKYESGTIKPAASVANLLRLLEADPSTLSTLAGRKMTPIASGDAKPFGSGYQGTGDAGSSRSPDAYFPRKPSPSCRWTGCVADHHRTRRREDARSNAGRPGTPFLPARGAVQLKATAI